MPTSMYSLCFLEFGLLESAKTFVYIYIYCFSQRRVPRSTKKLLRGDFCKAERSKVLKSLHLLFRFEFGVLTSAKVRAVCYLDCSADRQTTDDGRSDRSLSRSDPPSNAPRD